MTEESAEDSSYSDNICNSNIAHQISLDLTVEILTRLPAKSLMRFKCVSKEWLSIIRSQVFINSFNSMSQTQSGFLVAVRSAENCVFLLSSSHTETETSTTSLVTNLDLKMPSLLVDLVRSASQRTNLQMMMSDLLVDLFHCCSVHGIFCLSHPSDPGRFTICNPSTRQVVTLPDITSSNIRRKGIYVYLGYDPVNNEYKALCSTDSYGKRFQEHKVLTLGTENDLSWRDIKGRRAPCHTVVTNGICINGMVYYGGWTSVQEKNSMMYCFDVGSERIRLIKTPIKLKRHRSLINYNGKLGVVYPLSYDPCYCFDLYSLDDFDNYRWSRQRFNFHPLLSEIAGKKPLNILGVNKASEIILGPLKLPPKHEPLYIFYYNIGKSRNFIRRVQLEGFEEFGCTHTSDEQCVCQIFFSPEHFETIVSL